MIDWIDIIKLLHNGDEQKEKSEISTRLGIDSTKNKVGKS
jgi:hypothetical protein